MKNIVKYVYQNIPKSFITNAISYKLHAGVNKHRAQVAQATNVLQWCIILMDPR
jgi:hypothetical protein